MHHITDQQSSVENSMVNDDLAGEFLDAGHIQLKALLVLDDTVSNAIRLDNFVVLLQSWAEIVTLIFECIERFILDFPSSAPSTHDFIDIV